MPLLSCNFFSHFTTRLLCGIEMTQYMMQCGFKLRFFTKMSLESKSNVRKKYGNFCHIFRKLYANLEIEKDILC